MSRMEDSIAEKEDVYQNSKTIGEKTVAPARRDLPFVDYQSSNTGPKGVLNDYKVAKAREEERMLERAKADHEFVKNSALSAATVAEDEKRKLAEKIDEMGDDELDALVAGIDAQFEADLTALRVKEMSLTDTRMKTGVANRGPTGPSKTQGKQFGELIELQKEDLVDFVEKEDPNVLVFIHIYQAVRKPTRQLLKTNLRACARLSEVMATLCKMYPNIKWAQMCEDGRRDFDDDTLPILVAYRGGDVIESYVRLVDEIGHNFDLDDVIDFLEERKYLKSTEAVVDE